MESKRIEVVKLNVKEVIAKLNKLLADEWLAYYHYWVCSKIIKSPLRTAIVPELIQHANDEKRHAEMLADRIVQLGGSPLISPEQWMKETNCGYPLPTDANDRAILKQVIQGEQCAIEVYSKAIDASKDKDVITYQMLISILTDEVKHEEEFQNFVEDLDLLK